MNTFFLRVFSIFCLIMGAASLMCVTCHLHMLSSHCRRGFGVCVAQKHETCMTLKIYQNNTLQLSYMGCQKFCHNLSFDFNNRTYVHKCCNYNHCNFIV